MLKGIESVTPGYTGGTTADPTYEDVCSGTTGHAEAIKIEYDPAQISFRDLPTVFFATHDPRNSVQTLFLRNRQGNDIGSQYRSAIFYTDKEQCEEAARFIGELNGSNEMGDPVATTVEPLEAFYEAEDYHRDYYAKNKSQPYCQIIINPKLEKVQAKFAELLKEYND